MHSDGKRHPCELKESSTVTSGKKRKMCRCGEHQKTLKGFTSWQRDLTNHVVSVYELVWAVMAVHAGDVVICLGLTLEWTVHHSKREGWKFQTQHQSVRKLSGEAYFTNIEALCSGPPNRRNRTNNKLAELYVHICSLWNKLGVTAKPHAK